jgi:hypothetical protein
MVQVHKNLHRQYLDNREYGHRVLQSYVPFYTDIELITLTKESIFHQIKESRANAYYSRLWVEICERMEWQFLNQPKGIVRDIQTDTPASDLNLPSDDITPIASNG